MNRADYEKATKNFGFEMANTMLREANDMALGEAMGFMCHDDFFGHAKKWHAPSHNIDYLRRLVEAGAVLDADCGGFIGHNYIHAVGSENFSELEKFLAAYDVASDEERDEVYGDLYISIQTLPVFQDFVL